MVFPGGSDDKESACNTGNLGSIPGSERSPGEGNGYPFKYSCLENSIVRGARWDTVQELQSRTWLSDSHFSENGCILYLSLSGKQRSLVLGAELGYQQKLSRHFHQKNKDSSPSNLDLRCADVPWEMVQIHCTCLLANFSSCLQSFPELGSFPVRQSFASGGQSIGDSASASVLPMNIQDWVPLGWTGWISLQSKGLSRVFSHTTVQRHQFFSARLFFMVQLSHPYMTPG